MMLESCSPYYVLHEHLSALGILKILDLDYIEMSELMSDLW